MDGIAARRGSPLYFVISVVDVRARSGMKLYEFDGAEVERALYRFHKLRRDFARWKDVRVDLFLGDRSCDDIVGDEPWRLANDDTFKATVVDRLRELKPGESLELPPEEPG